VYVQPIMLTAMAGRPPITGVQLFPARPHATECEPYEADASASQIAESEATGLSGSGADEDELTISPEAEAQLVGQLTEEEQQQVEELKAADREVRSHEQAHLAAAGPHAKGGPTFTYQTGPDGRQYAVGGEVSIDVSPVPGDPEATIRKAQMVRAAALAPADPSAQDRAVAATATQMEAQAQMELQQQEQTRNETSAPDATLPFLAVKPPVNRKTGDVSTSATDALGDLLGNQFDAVA
jgi:hypothetical protein